MTRLFPHLSLVADKKKRYEIINLTLFISWNQFFSISNSSIPSLWRQCQESLSGRLWMYSSNLDLLYKSAEDAKADAKLWQSWTQWEKALNELPDEADNAVSEEATSTVEFHEKMQIFQESICQMLHQVHDIISNASLSKFVYHCDSTHADEIMTETQSSSDIHWHLFQYVENMSDEIWLKSGVSGKFAIKYEWW